MIKIREAIVVEGRYDKAAVLRAVDAGGVEENELILALGIYTCNSVSCCLGLFRYYCNLLPYYRVDKRGFSYIRSSH